MAKMTFERKEFRNYDCQKITFGDMGVSLYVATNKGPRIVRMEGRGTEDLLFHDTEGRGLDEWKLMDGHRVWNTRGKEADETPECYAPDNGECDFDGDDETLWVWGAKDLQYLTSRGVGIGVSKTGAIMVRNVLINDSSLLTSAGIWAITCTDPAGCKTYCAPLGSGGEWDTAPINFFFSWAGHTAPGPTSPQLAFTKRQLVIMPRGIEDKIALGVAQGWIGCHAPRKYNFFKIFKGFRGETANWGKYPLRSNAAFYIGPGNFMVEMESMGVYHDLIGPGEKVEHIEWWVVTDPIPWDQPERLAEVLKPHLDAFTG